MAPLEQPLPAWCWECQKERVYLEHELADYISGEVEVPKCDRCRRNDRDKLLRWKKGRSRPTSDSTHDRKNTPLTDQIDARVSYQQWLEGDASPADE